MAKLRILMVSPTNSPFLKKDCQLLEKHFHVRSLVYRGKRQYLKLLMGVLWANLTFNQFGDYSALPTIKLAKLLHKKTIIQAAGFEVVDMPEIDYGSMIDPDIKEWTSWLFKEADMVLAVSDSTKREAMENIGLKDVRRIYHGFDSTIFTPEKAEKENIILNVGGISPMSLRKKGLLTFAKTSKLLPQYRFVMAGGYDGESKKILEEKGGDNLEIRGWVSDQELISLMQKAKVYVQVSAHESFGWSVAESMLCGCVPVITRRAALPEVVGDTGFYVEYDNPQGTAEAIEEAFVHPELGKKARERIRALFPIEKRESELVKAIGSLLAEKIQ